MEIDFDRLRADLLSYLDGAYLIGGHGAALIERMRVETCSDTALIEIALGYGFRIENYSSKTGGNHHRR